MKDLFKNYHKHKVLSNLGVLSISAILAVSVNMFLLSGNTAQSLKANVLEATSTQINKVDFSATSTPHFIVFSNSQEIKNVTELSFSLAYNFELLELWEISTDIEWSNISVIENNDGFSSYIMTFTNPITISENNDIIKLDYQKTSEETVHLNIINVNFKDSEEQTYLLSTAWIIF